MKPKVMIAANTSWNLWNFRSGLIKSLLAAGYDVVAVAPPDKYARWLSELGCHFIKLPMDNKGTHPGRDLILLLRFIVLMCKERPNVFLSYTAKPNIYGSIAAHVLGIPVINNISGLGVVFIHKSWLTRLVTILYRLALSRSKTVFFQNDGDKELFLSGKLVPETVADRLPGSGIDLKQFRPEPLPNKPPFRFLLVARILWDKGVGEFVEAARILKQRGVSAEFFILGSLDAQNPTAISQRQVAEWVREGCICYLGVTDDVREEIIKADCVVLPSYREGVPRSLLEAAAMCRPLVAADSVGCRDVVEDGINGYLCRPRDANDLAHKLHSMVMLPRNELTRMGERARIKMENEFDEALVIGKYLKAICEALG